MSSETARTYFSISDKRPISMIKHKRLIIFSAIVVALLVIAGVLFSAGTIFKQSACKEFEPGPIFEGWDIPVEIGYCWIPQDNDHDVQLNNEQLKRTIFLAAVSVEKDDGSPLGSDLEKELNGGPAGTPKLSKEDGFYNLKTTRVKDGRVLIIVMTFLNPADEQWARNYIDSVK